MPRRQACDLSELYAQLARDGLLCGFEAHERFYEIGTPEGLAETEAFLAGLTVPTRLPPAEP